MGMGGHRNTPFLPSVSGIVHAGLGIIQDQVCRFVARTILHGKGLGVSRTKRHGSRGIRIGRVKIAKTRFLADSFKCTQHLHQWRERLIFLRPGSSMGTLGNAGDRMARDGGVRAGCAKE